LPRKANDQQQRRYERKGRRTYRYWSILDLIERPAEDERSGPEKGRNMVRSYISAMRSSTPKAPGRSFLFANCQEKIQDQLCVPHCLARRLTTRRGTPARAGTAKSDCSSDAAVGILAFCRSASDAQSVLHPFPTSLSTYICSVDHESIEQPTA
jgi:hypothetical protein